MTSEPELSCALVVPCYNEAKRLPVEALKRALDADPGLVFVLVDDGSTDDTAGVIEALAASASQVHAVKLEKNSGKAEAVRRGMSDVACGLPVQFVGYWDADFATPIEEYSRLKQTLLASDELLAVYGSRMKQLGSKIERSWSRHLIGRVGATLTSLALGLGVYDTQCGSKLFRNGPVVRDLFAQPFISRWLFDVELLVRVATHPVAAGKSLDDLVVELPVRAWRDVAGSKVRMSDFPRLLSDLRRISKTYPSARP